LRRKALTRIAGFLCGLSHAADRVLRLPDARWALVSTTITASVAIAVSWLSLAATPSSTGRAYEPAPQQAVLPYDLLLQLAGLHAIPAIPGEDSGQLYRSAGLIAPSITGPIERLLSGEQAQTKPQIETRVLKVGSRDTVVHMLEEAGVSDEDATAVMNALRPVYSLKKIRSGQAFQATFGPASAAIASDEQPGVDQDSSSERKLLKLTFAPSIDHLITVHLTAPDGYYLAENVERKLEERYQHTGGAIDSSLYLTATQAGIPASVVVEIIHMFSYEVDFQRDIHPGDLFEVFFSHYFTPDDQPAKPGDILAASLTLSGRKHLLYRFESADGAVEYFDANGESAKSMLMKTPVDGARISSGFGARLHPILGYTRMHKGIDFAVPTGTPVMAAGSGKVTFAGRAGEYGNFVVIDHGNGYSTAYGHLSRFAPQTRAGAHVSQGEVVAYSGMTGLATGPHLHYEIRIKNAPVNPATVKIASGRKLEGRELRAFLTERDRIETLEASLPIQPKLAQATISE